MKTTLSEKGQITIPKPVRTALGLRPGAVIEIRVEGGELIGKKANVEDVFVKWRGRGALPKGMSVDSYLERARGGSANGG
jgi:antitoxin PrlF